MTKQPIEVVIRTSPASVAGRMGRTSRFLGLGNLTLLAVDLLMLAGLWAWGSSNPHDPSIIGRGVLIFVLSNALVIGGGFLVAALTLVGLCLAFVGLLARDEPPSREGRARCGISLLLHTSVASFGLLVLVLLALYYPYLGWKFQVP
jgi:hypothetical protein